MLIGSISTFLMTISFSLQKYPYCPPPWVRDRKINSSRVFNDILIAAWLLAEWLENRKFCQKTPEDKSANSSAQFLFSHICSIPKVGESRSWETSCLRQERLSVTAICPPTTQTRERPEWNGHDIHMPRKDQDSCYLKVKSSSPGHSFLKKQRVNWTSNKGQLSINPENGHQI